jgi:Arc/MetJ family transcription regulator
MATNIYTSSTPVRRYDGDVVRTRTNIEIENDYVERIMRRYHLRTKTEAVDLALRSLAYRPMTREEALAMRGTFDLEVPPDRPPRGVEE